MAPGWSPVTPHGPALPQPRSAGVGPGPGVGRTEVVVEQGVTWLSSRPYGGHPRLDRKPRTSSQARRSAHALRDQQPRLSGPPHPSHLLEEGRSPLSAESEAQGPLNPPSVTGLVHSLRSQPPGGRRRLYHRGYGGKGSPPCQRVPCHGKSLPIPQEKSGRPCAGLPLRSNLAFRPRTLRSPPPKRRRASPYPSRAGH